MTSPNDKYLDTYLEDQDVFITGTGQVLTNIHKREVCRGPHCVIHNPSDHNLRDWPTHWRSDLGMFERICPEHGVGVPDPDDPNSQGYVYGSCGCEYKKEQN